MSNILKCRNSKSSIHNKLTWFISLNYLTIKTLRRFKKNAQTPLGLVHVCTNTTQRQVVNLNLQGFNKV
jgi:hypothetical protein